MTDAPEHGLAKNRADFLRRFFVGALSLGVAFALARLATTAPGGFASVPASEWVLLAAAVAVVLTSWEAYFLAVERFPLKDARRFYLDALIVLCYVALFASFQQPRAFLWCLGAVFLLYAAWDVLTWVLRDAPADSSPNTAYSLFFSWAALLGLALPWSELGLAVHAAGCVAAYRAALWRRRARPARPTPAAARSPAPCSPPPGSPGRS